MKYRQLYVNGSRVKLVGVCHDETDPLTGSREHTMRRGGTGKKWFSLSCRRRTSPALLIHWLLGCDCGEAGCWPLEDRIVRSDRQITWEQFKQPFRPERDYSSFGPFRFDIEQYRGSLAELGSKLPPD